VPQSVKSNRAQDLSSSEYYRADIEGNVTATKFDQLVNNGQSSRC
jgi:hypothetical protein